MKSSLPNPSTQSTTAPSDHSCATPLCETPAHRPNTKKSVAFTARLTAEERTAIEQLANDYECSQNDAIAVILDVVNGQQRPPILRFGVATPALLSATEDKAADFIDKLQHLTARLNVSLPQTQDAHLTEHVLCWRKSAAEQLPILGSLCEELQSLKLILLPGPEIDAANLMAVVDEWTSAMPAELAKRQARLAASNTQPADAIERTSATDQLYNMIGLIDVWELLCRSGIAKQTPPAFPSCTDAPGNKSSDKADPALCPDSKHGGCSASAPSEPKTRQISLRITRRHDRQLRSLSRDHDSCGRAQALRIAINQFARSPAAECVQTRVASIGDLYRLKRLYESLIDRLDLIRSRLAAPLPDTEDFNLLTQVAGWKIAVEELRPALVEGATHVRLIRKVLQQLPAANVGRARAALAPWVAKLPNFFARNQAQLIKLKESTGAEAEAARQTAANRLKYVDLWDFFFALGLVDTAPTAAARAAASTGQSPAQLHSPTPTLEPPLVQRRRST